ncbi:MAG TPA: sulfatase-like hydrolase/transferase [Candidatus Bathyarchaeia archaeon]|nr:sulfatase-like hydrolase/transferase [Candidatus Bathyarchaeia archaeon]
MTRRPRIFALALFFAATFAAFALLPACKAPAKPQDLNVLLVTIDTQRPDRLSCYDPKFAQTPQIDALAARGVLFERAFAHAPLTLPSHASILLGSTPLAHGADDNGMRVIPKGVPSLPKTLKAAGYATGAFVSAFPLDTRFGLTEGFDVYDDKYPARAAASLDFPERPAEKTVAAATDWLSSQAGRWFLWVHLFDPHAPYAPPEPYASRYAKDLYSGEVAYVDEMLGRLFQLIESRGETGRTLVVLTADHGESLGEHGEMTHSYFAYNSTLHVPLIVAVPGLASRRASGLVSHEDIFPTVCDVLGLPQPAGLRGRSFKPLLEGHSRKARPIYFEALEGYYHRGAAPLRGVIDGSTKFMDSPLPELYDIGADFGESQNLAAQKDLAPFRKTLEKAMAAESPSSGAGRGAARLADRETAERLRSLGYASAPPAPAKRSFTAAEDLKTLLPLEQTLLEAGQAAKDGRPEAAVSLLEDLIRVHPGLTRAYAQLAATQYAMGRADAHLQTLERGVQANPEDFTLVSSFGIALVERGDLARGLDVLGRALALFDQDPNVWGSLAEALWKTGDFEKADEDFRRALALAPGDAVINGNYANFSVAWGLRTRNADLVKRSFAYFEAALASDPTLASVYNGLGGAWKIAGDPAKAMACFERAIALDPAYDLPVYNLAVAKLEAGDKAGALALFEKYLALKGRAITPEEDRDVRSLIAQCRR